MKKFTKEELAAIEKAPVYDVVTKTLHTQEELRGDWIDEKCPKCNAQLLGNKVGDKWCSLVGCDYSLDKKDTPTP